MIYHIADKLSWERSEQLGIYEPPSLVKDGFIHACHKEQLASVRERYYAKVRDLLLLHIDEDVVSTVVKYELSPSVNEVFPHIYGPLNLNAVVKTEII